MAPRSCTYEFKPDKVLQIIIKPVSAKMDLVPGQRIFTGNQKTHNMSKEVATNLFPNLKSLCGLSKNHMKKIMLTVWKQKRYVWAKKGEKTKKTEQVLNLTVTAHRTLLTNVFIIGKSVKAAVATKVSLKLQANSKRIDLLCQW